MATERKQGATHSSNNGGVILLGVRKDAKTTQRSGGNTKYAPFALDAYDGIRVNAEVQFPVYSVSGVVDPASSATDVVDIVGSASAILAIRRIILAGQIASTAADQIIALIRRTTANSGGTSTDFSGGTAAAGTGMQQRDSGNTASVATVKKYTANPTLGTAAGTAGSGGTATGIIAQRRIYARVASTLLSDIVDFDFRDCPILLRGAAACLGINLAQTSQNLTNLDVYMEWAELPTTV